jgi:acetate kinase
MHVLCLDSGSSSLKHALYDMPGELLLRHGVLEASGPEQPAALSELIGAVRPSEPSIDAVGHRIVFGGPNHDTPQMLDDALVAELETLVAFDPLHLPAELALVRQARASLPSARQVACFDSAFHRRMPAVARRYPLPKDVGPMLQRYGYHGLSYEYIVSTGHAKGRAIVAHLGNGASLAAVRDGQPVDTTMGFTPLGGLMMGTRPGDLDPGVLLYLLRSGAFDTQSLSALLNERSGLLGVSGAGADMRMLLEQAPGDADARDAVELFNYLAVKQVGALAAVLGGLDTLIFTGGIGEHAAPIRKTMCGALGYLGVELDGERNDRGEERISSETSAVTVRVIPTDENLMIARHAYAATR